MKEHNMKKNTGLFLLALVSIGLCAEGFAQTVTNNNSITINGDVYYFKPSTTPSSPQPRVGSSNFISYGRWYGADAAKAWASIADWAIEHCDRADWPVTNYGWGNNPRFYISSVEARASGDNRTSHEIVIYYWVVRNGKRMDDGERYVRTFYFN
jgi:hypothetical protein